MRDLINIITEASGNYYLIFTVEHSVAGKFEKDFREWSAKYDFSYMKRMDIGTAQFKLSGDPEILNGFEKSCRVHGKTWDWCAANGAAAPEIERVNENPRLDTGGTSIYDTIHARMNEDELSDIDQEVITISFSVPKSMFHHVSHEIKIRELTFDVEPNLGIKVTGTRKELHALCFLLKSQYEIPTPDTY